MVIRSGGEHGWSFFRTYRVSDISSTRRRCPVCICCQQIERVTTKPGDRWPWDGPAVAEREAESDGRPKKASTDTRLSDVGISYDQSSPRQKLAAVPKEIFEHAVQDNTHMPTTAGVIQRQPCKKVPRPFTSSLRAFSTPPVNRPRHPPRRASVPPPHYPSIEARTQFRN